jgi:hypothetical protein
MRYVYISTPNDKKYLLFHNALVSEKNGKLSLYYYTSGVKRHFTVTFKSKDGILLHINPFNDNIVDYSMFIPETNPYFNINMLSDEFLYLDVSRPEVRETVKVKMHATFKRVLREYKMSSVAKIK